MRLVITTLLHQPAREVAAAQAKGENWDGWQAVETLQQQLTDLEA